MVWVWLKLVFNMYALSHDLCLGPEFDLLVYFETTKCVANTVSTCVFLNHVIPNESQIQ